MNKSDDPEFLAQPRTPSLPYATVTVSCLPFDLRGLRPDHPELRGTRRPVQ